MGTFRIQRGLASLIFAIVMVHSSMALAAGVSWREFHSSGNASAVFRFGQTIVTIQNRETQEPAFREDSFLLTVRRRGQKAINYEFSSSYGFGELAVVGDILETQTLANDRAATPPFFWG